MATLAASSLPTTMLRGGTKMASPFSTFWSMRRCRSASNSSIKPSSFSGRSFAGLSIDWLHKLHRRRGGDRNAVDGVSIRLQFLPQQQLNGGLKVIVGEFCQHGRRELKLPRNQ